MSIVNKNIPNFFEIFFRKLLTIIFYEAIKKIKKRQWGRRYDISAAFFFAKALKIFLEFNFPEESSAPFTFF